MKSFLMRFEEATVQVIPTVADNSSSKIGRAGNSKTPISSIVAGTNTFTEIKHESVDVDPGVSTLFAFPK